MQQLTTMISDEFERPCLLPDNVTLNEILVVLNAKSG